MGFSSRFKNDKTILNIVEEQPETNKDLTKDVESDFVDNSVDISSETVYSSQVESRAENSSLLIYFSDASVSKLTVTGNAVKIYRDNMLSEQLSLPEFPKDYIKSKSSVFKYIKDNLIISGVLPPVSAIPCLTIEKIKGYTPDELVSQKIISQKNLEFLKKIISARKNILITGNNSFDILNTITNFILKDKSSVVFQNEDKIKSSENVITFNTPGISDSDLNSVFQTGLAMEPEYIAADLFDKKQMSVLLALTEELNAKIYTLPAANASNALYNVLNMIMTYGHCNEKIAKSRILHSFNYILDKNSIYLIAPAKTAIITLKEVPV